MARFENILQTIGRTPIVKIGKLAPPGVSLYAKLEAFNPMGSVKDRLALGLIERAERSRQLVPGQTVIEATSGNTGIGLAMVCAQKGYPLVVIMAENFSLERRKLMRFLGARVVLTPASERGTGMLRKAAELAEAHGWFLCRQFENEANADVHSETTAREILEDFEGDRLDYWVTGFGTGGTLKGVARVLKQERPETHVVVCEPDNSRILASGIPQPRTDDGSPSSSHPKFRTHLMQGWAPDFVPRLTEEAVEARWIDRLVAVSGQDALRLSLELARQEGIFTGISGGATFAGALKICEAAPEGTTVLCMLPDTGERYLTTPLFEDIPVEMTEEESGISRSTPGQRFDLPTASPTPASAEAPITPEATRFIESTLAGADGALVMFSYEWCEFCWSLRRLFEACGVPYRSIDLDSTQHQAEDWGGKIRAALRARTGSGTMPQVFVGDTFLGGCTEVIEHHRSGELHRLLAASAIPFDDARLVDAHTFLPTWLHSR